MSNLFMPKHKLYLKESKDKQVQLLGLKNKQTPLLQYLLPVG